MKKHQLAIFQDSQDFECALLASLGFSNELIKHRTALTDGQIYYRLRKAKIRRQDYRNGISTLAKLVSNKVHSQAKADVERKLRKLISI